MAVIPVGQWLPDVADFGNPGAPVVKNAVPSARSYQPLQSLVPTTNSLDAYPRGAISAIDASENYYQYVGDAAKLYVLTAGAWTDVSLGGGYASGTDERWEFVRWAETIIATNFSNNPQQITLGGANFANLTTALRFRHVAVVNNFVVAGYTFDGTDGTVRDRVRWPAINDPTDWTISSTTLADQRDLAGSGIQRIVGGDYGVIVCEESTFRMTWAGSPTVFQIDETVPGIGSLAPGGVVRLGERVYFPSHHGFVAISNGATEHFIGADRVDAFFAADFDVDYAHRMSAVADQKSNKIFWSYPGAGNTGGRPNKLLIYDVSLDRWGYAEVELELIFLSGGAATTLEQLDDYNLGTEMVTNGDFASDTIWVKGTGWTIGSGVATHAAGTASSLSQTVTPTANTSYRVEFDVSGRTAGSITPAVGGTSGTAVSANGTDNKETIVSGAGTDIEFSATSDFDGSLDNISLRRNDLDSIPITLDSREFKGSAPLLAAFDGTYSSGRFTGTPYTATFELREVEMNPGYQTRLKRFTPLIDGGTITARVGERDTQSDEVTYTSVLSVTATGEFKPRSRARYHRVELTVSGDWKDAIGMQVEQQDAPRAGRRA